MGCQSISTEAPLCLSRCLFCALSVVSASCYLGGSWLADKDDSVCLALNKLKKVASFWGREAQQCHDFRHEERNSSFHSKLVSSPRFNLECWETSRHSTAIGAVPVGVDGDHYCGYTLELS